MSGFHTNIEEDTSNNTNFRKVIYTGSHMQLVLMSLKAGEEIGVETHTDVDQFFRFEEGEGKVVIDGQEYIVHEDDVVIVPAGSEHNVMNTGSEDLKIYTIYAPANHPEGTIHASKAEADAAEEHHL